MTFPFVTSYVGCVTLEIKAPGLTRSRNFMNIHIILINQSLWSHGAPRTGVQGMVGFDISYVKAGMVENHP